MSLDGPHPQESEPGFPGYCISIFDDSVWLSKELTVTPEYNERGIWPTWEEAQAARRKALGI